ncbi:MAG: hypothetical protein SGPRY_014093, partial [Prymnesium sp.]
MDWISAPHSLQGYRQRCNGWAEPIITDPRDHFCQPDLVDEPGEFGNRLFVAIGCSRVVAKDKGFSFQSLSAHFASHLRLRRLSTLDEQYRWLAQASDLFVTTLNLIGTTLAQIIYSSSPLDKTIEGPLIRHSAEPLLALREAEDSLEAMTNHRTDWEIFSGGSSTRMAVPDQLPLLSQRRLKGPARPPPHDSPSKSKKAKMSSGDPPKSAGLPPRLAEEINRASRCDKWGQRGHRSRTDSAHRIPNHPALDLDALSQKFARRVTREESDRLNAARAPPGRGRAKGQGRGRSRGAVFSQSPALEIQAQAKNLWPNLHLNSVERVHRLFLDCRRPRAGSTRRKPRRMQRAIGKRDAVRVAEGARDGVPPPLIPISVSCQLFAGDSMLVPEPMLALP